MSQMHFDLLKSLEILERTPAVLRTLLAGLSEEWITGNEGPETFSPFDVVGHLLHGEKTDWRERATRILEQGISKPFEPYDRFAQYRENQGKTLDQLLAEFAVLRKANLEWLAGLNLTETDFDRQGMHPSLGVVTMRQLLSTWVIHDLTHIAQITRVMAKQYKEEMGPWLQYFRIMNF